MKEKRHENVHEYILFIVLAYSNFAVPENKSQKIAMKTKLRK